MARPSSAASPGPGGSCGEVDVLPGQVGVDGGPAALLQRGETLRGRHRERQPAREQPEQRDRDVHLRPRRPGCAAPAPPSAGAGCPGRRRRRSAGRACSGGPRRSPGRDRARRRSPGRRGRGGCGPRAHRMPCGPRLGWHAVGRPLNLLELSPNLRLARAALDRAAERRARPRAAARAARRPRHRGCWLVGDRARPSMVDRGDGPRAGAAAPPEPSDAAALALFLGPTATARHTSPWSRRPAGRERRTRATWRTLRQVGADLGDRDAAAFATALALANWHAAHSHCPRCGAPTEPVQAGWLRRCRVTAASTTRAPTPP